MVLMGWIYVNCGKHINYKKIQSNGKLFYAFRGTATLSSFGDLPCRPTPDAFQRLDPEPFLRGGAIHY
jgi:hypothetical protein